MAAHTRFKRPLIAVILLFGSALTGLSQGKSILGKVVEVTDGDNITVLDKHKKQRNIRLAGIDAPEPDQGFGQQAKKFLSDLVLDKDVVVVGQDLKSGGRFLGKVLLGGRDINLEMVMSGFAWHYTTHDKELDDRDRQLYESAEVHARMLKFNLWSDPKPVPPWTFHNDVTGSEAEPQPPPTEPAKDPAAEPPVTAETAAEIVGNRKSKIYHWRGCPGYVATSEQNRIVFKTREEAEAAGYRAARNCKK